MYIIRRLVGVGFLVGIYLICAGAYDAFIQASARRTPETISISELQKNLPNNRHLIITGGTAVVDKAVEYYQTRHGVRVPNSEIYFIPIQDSALPASVSAIPPVLVKMTKDQLDKAKRQSGFDTSGIEGVRMTHWDLESKAKDYLVASFGNSGVEKMIILDYQREVVGIWRGLGQLLGGFALLGGLLLAFAKLGQPRPVIQTPAPLPSAPSRPASPSLQKTRRVGSNRKRMAVVAAAAVVLLLLCVALLPNWKQVLPNTVTTSGDEWPQWELPIRLGDSIETVRTKLGPESLDGKTLHERWAKKHHLDHYKPIDQDWTKFVTSYWQDRGLRISFSNGRVREIAVFMMNQPEYNARSASEDDEPSVTKYSGSIVAGVIPDDALPELTRKLGTPSTASPYGKFPNYEWRRGTCRIKARIAKEDVIENGVRIGRDRTLRLVIEDTAPEIEFEQQQKREEQVRREIADKEKALVALSGAELSPKEIFQKYSGRVVEVQALNSRGEIVSTGTGFMWRGDEVLTNCHVIEKARALKIARAAGTEDAFFASLRLSDGKLSHFSVEQDWVQLFLSVSKGHDLPPVVSAADLPEVGENITVIGNPERLTNSLSTGIVAGIREVEGNKWIQITAPVSPGSSGSPVFDSKGRVIGLATMMMIDGQNLNFATPVSQITSGLVTEPKRGLTPFKTIANDKTFEQKKRALLSGRHTPGEIKAFAEEFGSRYPDPEDQARIFYAVADTYEAQGEFRDAVKILQKKRERLGTDLDDYSRVADLLDEAGDVVAMNRELREGITTGIRKFAKEYLPDSRGTAATIAYMLDKLQDREIAARWFDIHLLLVPDAEWILPRLPKWYQSERAAREKVETDFEHLAPKDADEYIDTLRQRWRSKADAQVVALLRTWGLSEEKGKQLLRIGIDSMPAAYWEEQIRPKLTPDQWLLLRARLDERKSL
ncbi:MAG: hypothetical protein DLM73_03970 [Chthoniobacterales bacterium]|nr:MAG: hypothetical protein DLM73_03970 [Chthoniobacterales bacterium]